MKYKGKEYSVRDYGCKKLINVCFVPFSGNGQNICRLYERGQCPKIEGYKSKLKIGDILKVTQGGVVHYEKVIQIEPIILTKQIRTYMTF